MTLTVSRPTYNFNAKDILFVGNEVESVFDLARAEYPRFEDAYLALERLLMYTPSNTGNPINLSNGEEYRFFKQKGISGPHPVPNILVIFKDTPKIVEIHFIRVTAQDQADEEISLL